MIIEVTGTSIRNKGAELMLLAIKDQLSQSLPQAQLAVSPFFGSYQDKAKYGLLQKVNITKRGRSQLGFNMLPAGFLRAYGLVAEKDTNAVLDASGFAFGDQHEVRRTLEFAEAVKSWRAQRKKIILLPQALGPFTGKELSDAFKVVAENVDLIFARDDVSMEHLTGLCGTADKFRQAPDFTNLIKPNCSLEQPPELLIIPNHRMVEKMKADDAAAYVPFLAKVVEEGARLNLDTALLLHDTTVDHELVTPLEKELGRSINILQESDPLRLKAWLGAAKLVVGSRFHALVGSLAQGVPTLASGWSHKYQMLFADYGCPEMILPVSAPTADIAERMDQATNPATREQLMQTLTENGAIQRTRVTAMWDDVTKVLSA